METQPTQSRTYTLHVATPDGRLAVIDITDAVNRAYFIVEQPDGTPGMTDISDALPGHPDASLAHRIMLVTCMNPAGNGDVPVTVDPEAERVLAATDGQRKRQSSAEGPAQ